MKDGQNTSRSIESALMWIAPIVAGATLLEALFMSGVEFGHLLSFLDGLSLFGGSYLLVLFSEHLGNKPKETRHLKSLVIASTIYAAHNLVHTTLGLAILPLPANDIVADTVATFTAALGAASLAEILIGRGMNANRLPNAVLVWIAISFSLNVIGLAMKGAVVAYSGSDSDVEWLMSSVSDLVILIAGFGLPVLVFL